MKKGSFKLNIIKDYPQKGINFIDINPLLQDPTQFAQAVDKFCNAITSSVDKDTLSQTAILAPEARGFIFGAPVASRLRLPMLLIRKKGKIPNRPYSFSITNEYTSYDMEVDGDLLENHKKFIYIDDILATGQTLASVRRALKAKNKDIVFSAHLMDVADLKPLRDKNKELQGLPVEVIL